MKRPRLFSVFRQTLKRQAFLDGLLTCYYDTRPGFASKPVVQVTWEAARRYCEAYGKRLPTEAEWEFAARGTGRRLFPWGDALPACSGVVFGRTSGPCQGTGNGLAESGTATQDVTPEGVHDMGGNAAEWVMDWFWPRYPACPVPCKDPVAETPAPKVNARVVRGGDFSSGAAFTRGAGRAGLAPDHVKANVGFRCAQDLPPTPPQSTAPRRGTSAGRRCSRSRRRPSRCRGR